MPWKSAKQQRWGNSAAGKAALSAEKVNEFNQATNQTTLPGAVKANTKYPNLPNHVHRVTEK